MNQKEQNKHGLHLNAIRAARHLQRSVLRARQQLEVMDADGRDDVSFPPGVAGAVRERHLVVALAGPQQTQVLGGTQNEKCVWCFGRRGGSAQAGAGSRVSLQFEYNIMEANVRLSQTLGWIRFGVRVSLKTQLRQAERLL